MKKKRVIIPLTIGVIGGLVGAYAYAQRKNVVEPKVPPLTDVDVDVIKQALRNPDKEIAVESNELNPFTSPDDDDDVLERERKPRPVSNNPFGVE